MRWHPLIEPVYRKDAPRCWGGGGLEYQCCAHAGPEKHKKKKKKRFECDSTRGQNVSVFKKKGPILILLGDILGYFSTSPSPPNVFPKNLVWSVKLGANLQWGVFSERANLDSGMF